MQAQRNLFGVTRRTIDYCSFKAQSIDQMSTEPNCRIPRAETEEEEGDTEWLLAP
jgi:hypothetical protein